MRIHASRIFPAALACVAVSSCSTEPRLLGPGPDQYLIREACANLPPGPSVGGLLFDFRLEVDIGPRDTRNVSLKRVASGQEERSTYAVYGGGGKECVGGEVASTTMTPDGRFKFRYEFAGIVETASRKEKFVRVTIADEIRYSPGARGAGTRNGVPYRFYLD